jgi:predicted HTH transcriptional regulator
MPEDPAEWTCETIRDLVLRQDYEPHWFDFKEVIRPTSDANNYNARIRRSVCAMANCEGGYLIFGVKDRAVLAGTPSDRIVGIPVTTDAPREIAAKLGQLRPAVAFRASPKALPCCTDPSIGASS